MTTNSQHLDISKLANRLLTLGAIGCVCAFIWWLNAYNFAGDKITNFTKCLITNDPVCSLPALFMSSESITYNPFLLWASIVFLIIGSVLKSSLPEQKEDNSTDVVTSEADRLNNKAWERQLEPKNSQHRIKLTPKKRLAIVILLVCIYFISTEV